MVANRVVDALDKVNHTKGMVAIAEMMMTNLMESIDRSGRMAKAVGEETVDQRLARQEAPMVFVSA